MAERAEGWYVYCVLDADARPALGDLTGVDGSAPVEAIDAAGLRALVSRVPLDQFGEAPLRANLERIEWVERTARAHDAVLARTLDCHAVVPLRMFVIFADAAQVETLLARERERFAAALRRLRRHAEWSVKALVDERRLTAAIAAGMPAADVAAGERTGDEAAGERPGDAAAGERTGDRAALDAPGAGRAFFARRRAEEAGRERAAQHASAIAEEVHRRLRAVAADATLLPPQRRELSGRHGTMVLNGAYLVARVDEAAFSAAVTEEAARHRAAGVSLDVTGPWAPYNFVVEAPDDERRVHPTGEPAA
jgi:hypothetical protein